MFRRAIPNLADFLQNHDDDQQRRELCLLDALHHLTKLLIVRNTNQLQAMANQVTNATQQALLHVMHHLHQQA